MNQQIAIVGEAWRQVPLTQGFVSLVDAEDYERCIEFNWCVIGRPNNLLHAARKNKGRTVFLHHFILGWKPRPGFLIDHISNDGLDNRKHNLREATKKINALNSERSRLAKIVEPHGNRFRVRPFVNGKRTVIGSFATREEAELAVLEYRRGL